jgi:glycosyltransferase involved in cell wall biosynthesis
MTPEVSIIIPAYNAGRYLRQCLDSVLAQTLTAFEAVVVDDASTDDTREILERYAAADRRIVPVRHAERRRQGAARNTGVARAAGRCLAFVDSDDWIAPTMYEKLLAAAEDGPCDVAACGMEWIWPPGADQKFTYSQDFIGEGGVKGLAALAELRWLLGPCNKLFRRELFLDHGIRFGEQGYYEDSLPALEAVYHARRIRALPEILYYYRQHPSSTTNRLGSAVLCDSRYRQFREVEGFFSRIDPRGELGEIRRRIRDQFLDWTYNDFLRYCLRADHNGVSPADDPVIAEGLRIEPLAGRLLGHLLRYRKPVAGPREQTALLQSDPVSAFWEPDAELQRRVAALEQARKDLHEANAALMLTGDRMQKNYEILEGTISVLRDGGEGVRNHFRYLSRAVRRAVARKT